MGRSKKMTITLAERCKNIMLSNWRGQLFTVSVDGAKGSNKDLYSTSVRYTMRSGKPCIWVPEDDQTNMNYVFDGRASFSVTNPFPGALAALLQSQDKTPPRVALSGEIARYPEEKLPSLREKLQELITAEQSVIRGLSSSVSSLLDSSKYAFLWLNIKPLLDPSKVYDVYQFIIRSISFVDCDSGTHDVSVEDFKCDDSKMVEFDWIPLFATKMIDAINLCEPRRRALAFLCYTRLEEVAKDAFVLSVDRKGLDVLGLVRGAFKKDGSRGYEWKELRLCFNEEAQDVNTFCTLLSNMEREAIHEIRTASGLF